VNDSIETFAEASRSEGPSAVESGALVIGAYATVDSNLQDKIAAVVRSTVNELDDFAAEVEASTAVDLMLVLFGSGEFSGNMGNYYDPGNSLLPLLLKHRRGNPITLSALAMAIGRRKGITLNGVSMPGHFLLSSDDSPGVWLDPFHAGSVLTETQVRERFHQLHGESSELTREHLQPAPAASILARMLNNLRFIYGRLGSLDDLAWLGLLSASLPDGGPQWAEPIAAALASQQRNSDAAAIFDVAAEYGPLTSRANYLERAQELRDE
jgi:regulator of sirC expression with transglutaminase-like and TPR domain